MGRLAPAHSPLGLDFYLPALCALGLRHANSEDTVHELGIDLLHVHLIGERDAVLEAARAASLPPEHPLPLALLHLARDHELIPDQLDVDVLLLDAGEFRLDHIRIVSLLDVNERRPTALLRQ